MMRRQIIIGICAAALLLISAPRMQSQAASEEHVYSTWQGHMIDLDANASAWLIKRFIDRDAEFRYVQQGALEMEGVPFSVPQADWSVQPGKTVFELILAEHELDDPALLALVPIIRDIEINKWGEKQTPEAPGLEAMLRGATLRAGKDDEKMRQIGAVFLDCLYADLKNQLGM